MFSVLNGALDFNDYASKELRALLRALKAKQAPEVLFISCSDSRVVPVVLTDSLPGDLFTLRNIGNIVPDQSSGDNSAAAAVEYPVLAVGTIETIVICGHSNCGAMKAILAGEPLPSIPNAEAWLKHGASSLEAYKDNKFDLNYPDDLPESDKLAQVSVIQQFHNLLSYPHLKEAVETKSLNLVGAFFDIGDATTLVFVPEENAFLPVDEEVALSGLEGVDMKEYLGLSVAAEA